MDTSLPWIAVVDDEESIRRAMLRLLRSAGITARAYADGPALLAALDDGPAPCCAVLDVHMSGMSGLELQQRLAERSPDTTVIIMTGHHTADEEARAMQLNPAAYLLKPVNDLLLLAVIANACPAFPFRLT